jgi:HEAT repeat protein
MATIIDRYRKRLAALPALARFCEQAEELVRADDPETFWRAEPAFRDLLRSDFIQAFVTHELGLVAQDDFHFMLASSETHSLLVESAGYSLLLKLLSPEATETASILSSTEHVLLAVWGGSVEMQTFAMEQPFYHEVFDRSKRPVPGERIRLEPGMVAQVRSPHEMYRLRLERPTLMIQLQSATTVPLRWVFHPETLEPMRAVASRLSSSRLQFTCHTLAALGSSKSIPALKRLMTHPEHYVRWAAIQGICAISREEGIACLRQSLEDKHPHIRNAAQKTLANF